MGELRGLDALLGIVLELLNVELDLAGQLLVGGEQLCLFGQYTAISRTSRHRWPRP